jgi:hypothetical protein
LKGAECRGRSFHRAPERAIQSRALMKRRLSVRSPRLPPRPPRISGKIRAR